MNPKLVPRLVPSLALFAILLPHVAPAGERAPTQDRALAAADHLPYGRAPVPGMVTGGEPGPEGLDALAAAGFRTVINLRTEGEASAVGASEVEGRGMRYVSIPVAGAEGLTRENVEALDRILDDPDTGPVVLFCGSGNRVGALLALRAAWLEGADPDAALELGRAAGLTRLEPAVRTALGLSEN